MKKSLEKSKIILEKLKNGHAKNLHKQTHTFPIIASHAGAIKTKKSSLAGHRRTFSINKKNNTAKIGQNIQNPISMCTILENKKTHIKKRRFMH